MAISSVLFIGPLAAVVACVALGSQPAAAQETQDQHPQCVSHLWAAGVQLGRADAIAHQDASSADAEMLDAMRDAGTQVEKANALCAKQPAPWPAWPDWRKTQDQLTEMVDKFQGGQMTRQQVAIRVAALQDSLALQLAFRVLPTHVERDATCEEIYTRLGNALSFARTTTRISGHLTRDAALRLRRSLSLIYQTREMPHPCLDFKGLIPAINVALKSADSASIVGQLDDIVHAGDVVAGPPRE